MPGPQAIRRSLRALPALMLMFEDSGQHMVAAVRHPDFSPRIDVPVRRLRPCRLEFFLKPLHRSHMIPVLTLPSGTLFRCRAPLPLIIGEVHHRSE